ncbi:ABC transporter permease [Congregibacter sp.]|jgi:putative ABC transport system permease protein|uniref:ABC transporter permease n=1 Tax=Congregibacter sp. TaxID=2744308 RepID=UPI0039E291B9
MSFSHLPLRASARFYLQHPLQLMLTLLGIALGAAVIIAVALATRAATVSFDRSLTALAGPMSHELRALEGPLDEGIYTELRLKSGLHQIMPVISVPLTFGDAVIDLVGLDPLAMTGNAAAPGALPAAAGVNIAALMTSPDAVIASASIAERAGLEEGTASLASIEGRPVSIRPVSIFPAAPGDWFGDVLLADIAMVQDISGRSGELDRIQLQLSPEAATLLRDNLPAGTELRAFDDQRQTFDDMTLAFRTNLAAMSLLAILVGAFLVYNAMAFAVVQRTPTFAILRMLGATPSQLFRRLLLEATVLGLLGGVLGILLGIMLGQSLLVLVTRTVSDLYVRINATAPDITVTQLAAVLAITLAAVLIATLAPARAAAKTAPATLERESASQDDRAGPGLLLTALVLVLSCPVLIALSGQSLITGFVALFLLIAGYSLLCAAVLRLLLGAMVHAVAGSGGVSLQLALRGLQSALPRTAPAIVALTVAVSATVGVSIMIGSFRTSVESWLDATLQGDLYIYDAREGKGLDPALADLLADVPGVQRMSAARQKSLRLDGEMLSVLVLDAGMAQSRHFELLAGAEDAAARLLREGGGLLVSEPLANRRGLSLGDTLALTTPQGIRNYPIKGIYRDFASSYGAAVLPFSDYAKHWQDREISTLAVILDPEADADTVQQHILALAAAQKLDLQVIFNNQISERSLAIFDRTFVITDVLRALVVLVAFVGIVSALMALFLERRREFAILRATGVTPGQLQALVLAQAALSGALAGLLALPLGGAMSLLLIDVINQRSFGWTMATVIDGSVVLNALLLAVFAAALAAIWPARRLAGGDLREALYAP